jgi:hypothetical protein
MGKLSFRKSHLLFLKMSSEILKVAAKQNNRGSFVSVQLNEYRKLISWFILYLWEIILGTS